MAEVNANTNMDDEINNSRNLSNAEMAENALGGLTRPPYLLLSPWIRDIHTEVVTTGRGVRLLDPLRWDCRVCRILNAGVSLLLVT